MPKHISDQSKHLKGAEAETRNLRVKASSQVVSDALTAEEQEIVNWFKTVKFKKVGIGGVSEEDVWKKISELNSRYDAALRAERARYDALLEQQRRQNAGNGFGSGRHYG